MNIELSLDLKLASLVLGESKFERVDEVKYLGIAFNMNKKLSVDVILTVENFKVFHLLFYKTISIFQKRLSLLSSSSVVEVVSVILALKTFLVLVFILFSNNSFSLVLILKNFLVLVFISFSKKLISFSFVKLFVSVLILFLQLEYARIYFPLLTVETEEKY